MTNCHPGFLAFKIFLTFSYKKTCLIVLNVATAKSKGDHDHPVPKHFTFPHKKNLNFGVYNLFSLQLTNSANCRDLGVNLLVNCLFFQ